jgi:large subunit ribosomal protein L7/L12
MPWEDGVYRTPTTEEWAEMDRKRLSPEDAAKFKEAFIKMIDDAPAVVLKEMAEHMKLRYHIEEAFVPEGPAVPVLEDQEPEIVTLVLEDAGAKSVPIVRVVRSITALGLKEAHALVKSAPSLVLENVLPEIAESAAKELRDLGATVSIR